MATYSPKLPLTVNNGKFVMVDNSLTNIKQKLKMLVLTNPGEKLMDPAFGVGVRRYLFENANGITTYRIDAAGEVEVQSHTELQAVIREKILAQTTKYMPDIKITSVTANIQNNILNVRINYNIKNIISDNLQLQVQ